MSLASRARSLRIVTVLALVSSVTVRCADAAGGIGDLYITSDASNIVRAYNGTTGAFLGNHAPSVLGSGQMAIHFGASNGRFLVGSAFGGVDEYNSATGAYIKTYSPGGGWQWAGIYAPNGNVYIGSMSTNDVREYDVNTGAFVRVVCTVPGPADMRIGPNGNLYICSYTNSLVQQNDPATGNFINMWSQTAGDRTNDIAFLPNGEILVTVMSSNVFYRYSPALVLLGSYFGSGWLRPHGIDISPHDGNIYVVDGVTTQVHVFDPVTFAELNPAFLSPNPGDKIVDLEFRPDPGPTPVQRTTWGRVKALYK
jgi:WD40 repeat protein